MRKLFGLLLFAFTSSVFASESLPVGKLASADTPQREEPKKEIKKEEPKKEEPKKEEKTLNVKSSHTETININTNKKPELMREHEDFCGTSKADCKKQCMDWLKEQKKTLKGSIRTSHCSSGKDLYGKEENGCMNVSCYGEIKYILQ